MVVCQHHCFGPGANGLEGAVVGYGEKIVEKRRISPLPAPEIFCTVLGQAVGRVRSMSVPRNPIDLRHLAVFGFVAPVRLAQLNRCFQAPHDPSPVSFIRL